MVDTYDPESETLTLGFYAAVPYVVADPANTMLLEAAKEGSTS